MWGGSKRERAGMLSVQGPIKRTREKKKWDITVDGLATDYRQATYAGIAHHYSRNGRQEDRRWRTEPRGRCRWGGEAASAPAKVLAATDGDIGDGGAGGTTD